MAFVTYEPGTDTAESLVSAIFAGNDGATLVAGSVHVRYGVPEGETSTISYYDGAITPLNIGAGLLLTSGDPTPPTKNTATGYGKDAGDDADVTDADLQNTVDIAFDGAGQVKDVTVLEFQILVTDPDATGLRFEVVFCSEEYPEFSGSSFVDVAGIYINGHNYALFDNDPLKPLSVVKANLNPNWSGHGLNGYFRDNSTLPIEYDGISVKLQITAPLEMGVNTVKIAIADTGDSILDSAMFISNMNTTNYGGYGLSQQVFVPDIGLTDIPSNQTYLGGDNGTNVNFTEAGGGQDVYDGGGGVDTATFEATQDQLTYTINADGIIVVKNGENETTLLNVEHLAFGDGTMLALDTQVGDNTYMVELLLNAWFDENPDTNTLSQWVARSVDLFNAGLGYVNLADEIVQAYSTSPYLEDAISHLYFNIIGSEASADMVAWLASLVGMNAPFQSIGDLFLHGAQFTSNSVEIADMVGTVVNLNADYF